MSDDDECSTTRTSLQQKIESGIAGWPAARVVKATLPMFRESEVFSDSTRRRDCVIFGSVPGRGLFSYAFIAPGKGRWPYWSAAFCVQVLSTASILRSDSARRARLRQNRLPSDLIWQGTLFSHGELRENAAQRAMPPMGLPIIAFYVRREWCRVRAFVRRDLRLKVGSFLDKSGG
jgi:hypothetical protein